MDPHFSSTDPQNVSSFHGILLIYREGCEIALILVDAEVQGQEATEEKKKSRQDTLLGWIVRLFQ